MDGMLTGTMTGIIRAGLGESETGVDFAGIGRGDFMTTVGDGVVAGDGSGRKDLEGEGLGIGSFSLMGADGLGGGCKMGGENGRGGGMTRRR